MNRALILSSAAALPMLADASLKSAVLLLLAGACVLLMRRASAAARHMVWLAAVLALLFVPVFSIVLPGWRVLPRWAVMDARNEGKDGSQKPDWSVLRPASPPLTHWPTEAVGTSLAREPVLSPPSDTAPSSLVSYSSPTLPVPPALAATPAAPESARASTVAAWLFPLWAAGCAVLLVRLGASYFLLCRATRRCATATAPIAAAFAAAAEETGHRHPVRLLMDPHRTIPVVWGLFRPRLLLPAEAATWPESQLRSVLLHELAHLRRRDPLVQFLAQLACALHWFNPLVWFAAWRLHVERERACDDLVLAAGVRPSAYAEHLLHIATQLSPARWTQACGLAMARKSSLEGRLLAVLSDTLNRRRLTRALTAAAILLSTAIAVPIAMLRAADDQSAEPSPAEHTTRIEAVKDGNEPGFPGVFVIDDEALDLPDAGPGPRRSARLKPATEEKLSWGKEVDGLRAALVSLRPQRDLKQGAVVDLNLVVQNVSDAPVKLRGGSPIPTAALACVLPGGTEVQVLQHIVDILSTIDEFILQPREVGVMSLMSVGIGQLDVNAKSADGRTVGYSTGKVVGVLAGFTGSVTLGSSADGFWKGTLPLGRLMLHAAHPDAEAAAEKRRPPGEAQGAPKHKDARALYEIWQRHTRANGDIPGALIGELAAAVKVFINYNPTYETVPKLNKILPRLDAAHDWKADDAIALLDEVAAVQDSPLQAAAEKMTTATIRHGEALPEKFAGLAWGETQPNGLRAAWVLEPGAVAHRLGTALKARLLVQNAGTVPVMVRVPTWHQGEISARDAAGAEVQVSGISWTTIAWLVPVRLGPGEFIEINAPGVGLGKDAGRGPWAGPRVGSNVLANPGDELTLAHDPVPLDGSGVGMREDAPHLIGPGWWQAHIKTRLSRELPLPASVSERTHLLERAVRDLFSVAPTAEEMTAITDDQTPGALDALARRLAARADTMEFAGSLPPAPVTFRVLPADPAADTVPRVVLGPGEYPIGNGATLKMVGRLAGDRYIYDTKILFEPDEAAGRLAPEPHPVEMPEASEWAIVCRPGEGAFYVLNKGGVRKIDFTQPRQVTDTPAADLPAGFREEVKRQLDIREMPTAQQAEILGVSASMEFEAGRKMLDAATEAQLDWGEASFGLRGALLIRSPGEGRPDGIDLVVQNVSDEPRRFIDTTRSERLRTLYLSDTQGILAGLSNDEPTMTDVTLQPREVVFLNMMRSDGSAEVPAGLIEGLRKDSLQRWFAVLRMEFSVLGGGWSGTLTTGETRLVVREGGPVPKNARAQTLFKVWQSSARLNGDIPGGLVRLLHEKVKDFIRANEPDASGGPFAQKMKPLEPRFANAGDWKAAEVVALLDDIATVHTIPLDNTLTHLTERTLYPGTPLPASLEKADWGEPLPSGLRVAHLLEPRAGAYHLGTELKARLLFHNAGKEPVTFITDTFQQPGHSARRADGSDLKLDATEWLTLGSMAAYRLAPGEYCEIHTPGLGIGAQVKGREDWEDVRAGSWILCAEGDEVVFTPGAAALSYEKPEGQTDWWLDFITERLNREAPVPTDTKEREYLLYRVVRDLYGAAPSTTEGDAFAADTSPDALKNLAVLLTKHPYGKRSEGVIRAGSTKFRVLPPDADADKRPRLATGPGWYSLGDGTYFSVTRRPHGSTVVNEASIVHYQQGQDAVVHKVALPAGYDTWAAGMMKGATELWVSEFCLRRKLDFSNPLKVVETRYEGFDTTNAPIPKELRGVLDPFISKPVPGATKSKQSSPPPAEAPAAPATEKPKGAAADIAPGDEKMVFIPRQGRNRPFPVMDAGDGVTLAIHEQTFHAADVMTTVRIRYTAADGTVTGHDVQVAMDAFANREKWAFLWVRGTKTFWHVNGEFDGKRLRLYRTDFADPRRIVTAYDANYEGEPLDALGIPADVRAAFDKHFGVVNPKVVDKSGGLPDVAGEFVAAARPANANGSLPEMPVPMNRPAGSRWQVRFVDAATGAAVPRVRMMLTRSTADGSRKSFVTRVFSAESLDVELEHDEYGFITIADDELTNAEEGLRLFGNAPAEMKTDAKHTNSAAPFVVRLKAKPATVDVGKDGALRLNGKAFTLDALKAAAAHMPGAVVIRADKEAPFAKVQEVVEALKSAGAKGVSFASAQPAVKLTPEGLLGTWRGTVNEEKLTLSFHRPPAEEDVQCDIYFGEATIGVPAGFTIAEDGGSAEVVQHSAGGGMKFGTLIPDANGKLKLELYGRQVGQQETMLTRDSEPPAIEPQQKEARELFEIWKATANADGSIPGTFIGTLATEVRAYVKANPTLDSAANLPKLLPRFVTSRDWTQAEAVTLLDDVAYYSTAPIEARVAKAKLPSGPLWRTMVEFQDIPVEIAKWSEAEDGLRIGMRVVEADWRTGGSAHVELWLHNAGNMDVSFRTAGPSRQDVEVMFSALDTEGREHWPNMLPVNLIAPLMDCTLPAGHVAGAKVFTVSFAADNGLVNPIGHRFLDLKPGNYQLRPTLMLAKPEPAKPDEHIELKAPDFAFTLGEATAAEEAKPAAKTGASGERVNVPPRDWKVRVVEGSTGREQAGVTVVAWVFPREGGQGRRLEHVADGRDWAISLAENEFATVACEDAVWVGGGGSFHIGNVPPGNPDAVDDREGARHTDPDKPFDLRVWRGDTVKGRVRLPGGKPAAGVQVRLGARIDGPDWIQRLGLMNMNQFSFDHGEHPNWHSIAVTNEHGEFEGALPPNDACTFTTLGCGTRDTLRYEERWEPAPAGDGMIAIQLEAGVRVHGRVVDTDGKPVARAEVFASGQHRHEDTSGLTDAEGRYELRARPGVVRVSVDIRERNEKGEVTSHNATGIHAPENVVIPEGAADYARDFRIMRVTDAGPVLPPDGKPQRERTAAVSFLNYGKPLSEFGWVEGPWGPEQNGLSLAMELDTDKADQWRPGGAVQGELYVRNTSAAPVTFPQHFAMHVGLAVTAHDKDGKDHSARITVWEGCPALHHLTLLPGHAARVKLFTLQLDPPDSPERKTGASLNLAPGPYTLRARWSDAHALWAHEGEWTGALESGEVDFSVAAAVAGTQDPKRAAADTAASAGPVGKPTPAFAAPGLHPTSTRLWNDTHAAYAVQSEKEVNFVLLHEGSLSTGMSETWGPDARYWAFEGAIHLVDSERSQAAGQNVDKRVIAVKYTSNAPTTLFLDGKAYDLANPPAAGAKGVGPRPGRLFILRDEGDPIQTDSTLPLRHEPDLVTLGKFASRPRSPN